MTKRRVGLSGLVLVALAGTAWALTFASPVKYTTLASPRCLAVGSLKGNGILDIVVGDNPASGTVNVSVFLGNGDGTFGAKADIDSGALDPTVVILADLRQNGKLDAVVTDYSSAKVAVMLGNGDGTFAAATDLGTGANPYGVAAGSLQNNGKIDLVVANAGGNTISVFLGNGNGTFGAGSTYPTGSGPETVALGDFDGDGFLDAVVNDTSTTKVSVLLGNGLGGFGVKTDISVGAAPGAGLAVADLRHVGKLDIVVAVTGAAPAGVAVLLGNGNGTFASQVTYPTGINPWSVTIADLDGDGNLDIVTRNYGAAWASYVRGNGDGTFTAAATIGADVTADPSWAAVGDFDGDGKLDVATTAYTGGAAGLVVLLQTTSDHRGLAPTIGGNLLPIWKNTQALTGEFRSGTTGKTTKGE